ncbi:hypothetical protein AAEX28_07110 [Lentisphaerota bacterium WC36G]|nr:hypothetical protein LJT99_09975 [Lentisphaerae bacterium WC36]
MNIFSENMQILNDQMNELCGESVEYLFCDNTANCIVTARRGKSTFTNNESYSNFARYSNSVDFLIATASLARLPKIGDAIKKDNTLFEVSSFNQEPCFRYSDNSELILRVHTKRGGNAND